MDELRAGRLTDEVSARIEEVATEVANRFKE